MRAKVVRRWIGASRMAGMPLVRWMGIGDIQLRLRSAGSGLLHAGPASSFLGRGVFLHVVRLSNQVLRRIHRRTRLVDLVSQSGLLVVAVLETSQPQ